jgi:hypothetical protein
MTYTRNSITALRAKSRKTLARSPLAFKLYMYLRQRLLRPHEVWQGKPKTILFLVGPGHTGSTLLNFMLDSHTRVFGAGELAKLESPKWRKRHTMPSTMCAVCLDCDFWPKAFEVDSYQDIYLRLIALLGSDTVVDSSKDPLWAARQGSVNRGVCPKYVRLVRDGRGCVASYRRYGRSIAYSVERWKREEEEAVAFFSALDPGLYITVKYEALASDTESTLAELCDFLNIEFEPDMIEYWIKEHHALGGNAGTKTAVRLHHNIPITTDQSDIGVYIEKGRQVFLDERWKEELTNQDLEVFDQMAGDLNRANGYNT